MIRIASLCLAMSAPADAMADPFGLVDYDAVIDGNLDSATAMQTGDRRIDLPGGVQIMVDTEGQMIFARDPGGAIGCLASLLVEFSAIARSCPGALSPGDADGLDTAIGALIPAYAAGVLPDPADPADVADRFEAAVQARTGAQICDMSPDFRPMLDAVTSPDGVAQIVANLSRPRLPVSEPCF